MTQANTSTSAAQQHYPELQLFIAGEWVDKGDREGEEVINPATGELLGILPHATTGDMDRALAAAEQGFKLWRNTTPDERSAVLRKAANLLRERAEQIVTVCTLESGKPLAQSRVELQTALDRFEWYAEEGRRTYGRVLARRPGSRLTVVKEPIGPVAAFSPWNFPQLNPARKLGAPLAAGCSCILKPAEETPGSALIIARALQEAGLPDGVLSVLYGVPHQVSSHLLSSPIIRKLSFTGSVPVGKQLVKQAAERMIRTTMELGGHGPVMVFDDVDVERVIDACVTAKLRNGGQVCVSPTRFYIHDSLYTQFVEGFSARIANAQVGNGLDEGSEMGPLIHDRRRKAVDELVQDAVQAGATLHAGGKAIDGPGFFYRPTVLGNIPETARIMNEEPFGPVALVNPFSDIDEMIANANRLPFGLAAFAFTDSASRIRKLGDELEVGMLAVNSFAVAFPDSPFGGVKESGHGKEDGIEGLEACLVTKFISEM